MAPVRRELHDRRLETVRAWTAFVEHGDGIETLYCHLSEAAVANGQPVGAGQRIGSVGSSGFSTGPHLHFEVHRDGRAVDPATWLPPLPATIKHTGGN